MMSSLNTHRNLWAAATAIGALLMIGAAQPVAAQPEQCAQTIAKELRKTMKTGQKNQDKCHKLANKICVGTLGVCNNPDTLAFQIVDKGKYEATKAKSLAKINAPGGVCAGAAAVLDQYPGDNVANITEYFDDLLANRADLVLGGDDLACDEAAVACFKTISKNRASVADKMLNAAIKCMKDATPGAALALPDCLNPAPIQSAADKAAIAIAEACTGFTGADVGSCDPLPTCVADAAVAEGQTAATRIYPADNCSPVTGANSRTANVSLSTPTELGGVTIELIYPQFVMGLPENGSDIDGGDFSYSVGLLDAFDLDGTVRISAADFVGISSGNLVDIAFDKCRDLVLGTCAGNGAITCNNSVDCGANAPCIITNGVCSFSTFTNCGSDTDCPSGESCVAQQTAMSCTVVAASDTGGNPVDGATCSVTLSEP